MTFINDKKTFLAKQDKSKKGHADERIVPLLNAINGNPDYYTTSSCSGRVYFWRGTRKKNEMERVKISHETINEDFFQVPSCRGTLWLRMEPMILHVVCRDMSAAHRLLDSARKIFKKSCLLSARNKIVMEIRGSEFLEMPFSQDGKLLFSGDLIWLKNMLNEMLQQAWSKTEQLRKSLYSKVHK